MDPKRVLLPAQRVMKSLGDKARAERVVATLMRLRGNSNVGTIEQELATLARGDARHERTDQSNEHHEAFLAIQALRTRLATAPTLLPLWPPLTFKHFGRMPYPRLPPWLPLPFKHFGRMPYPRRASGYRRSISEVDRAAEKWAFVLRREVNRINVPLTRL